MQEISPPLREDPFCTWRTEGARSAWESGLEVLGGGLGRLRLGGEGRRERGVNVDWFIFEMDGVGGRRGCGGSVGGDMRLLSEGL